MGSERSDVKLLHPDRKPWGDMPTMLQMLIAGRPGTDFLYEQGSEGIRLNTREVVKL